MEAAHEVLFNADLLLNHITPHLSFADFGQLRMACKRIMEVIDGSAPLWRAEFLHDNALKYEITADYAVTGPLPASMQLLRGVGKRSHYYILRMQFLHSRIAWGVTIGYTTSVNTLWYGAENMPLPQWLDDLCRAIAEPVWKKAKRRWASR